MHPHEPRHGVRPSLWLLPDEALELTALSGGLVDAHGGPAFTPHLTLLGSVFGTRAVLHAQAERLAERLSPMILPTAGVYGSEQWFRCITLHIAMNSSLRDARELAEQICGAAARPWVPHISLLYGHLTTAARAAAIATLAPAPSTVSLSTLALVETVGPAEDWIVRARFPLSRD